MFGFEIQIQLLKGKRKEFLQAFEFLVDKTSECIGRDLYEDANKDNRFLWAERWTDLKGIEDHMRSDRFKSLLGAIDVLGELEKLQIVEFRAPPDNLR
jgi:quinol monooxygenase YgiN